MMRERGKAEKEALEEVVHLWLSCRVAVADDSTYRLHVGQ
jgi:hypothetical protein